MPVWHDQHAAVPDAVRTELQALFTKYYPDGAFTNRVQNGVHFEHNATIQELPPLPGNGKQERRRQLLPGPGGVTCSVYLQEGSYKGQLILWPAGNGQFKEHLRDKPGCEQLLIAPYSSTINSHLWTSLQYPPDANADFLR